MSTVAGRRATFAFRQDGVSLIFKTIFTYFNMTYLLCVRYINICCFVTNCKFYRIQSQGLQTRIVNPNIMRLVCENTSLSNLKPTLSGDLIILWANDIEDAHKISKFAKKIHWITLLGI